MAGLSRFARLKVGLDGGYIAFKGLLASSSDLAEGLRVVITKLLDDFNIPGFFQLIDLHTEVSRRGICPFFQQGKFRFLFAHQYRHHCQPEL